jgi:hypothetical protein
MSDPNLRGIMVDDLRTGRRPIGSVVEAQTVNDVTTLYANGLPLSIGSDTILSTTHIRLSATTASLASGSAVAFNAEVRDDLNLFDPDTAGRINLPVGVTQFRWGYSIRLSGDSSGVASAGTATAATRRINSVLITGGGVQDMPTIGVFDADFQYPGIGAGAQALVWSTSDAAGCFLHYQSPWIDVASLTTAPSGVAGEDIITFSLTHNAGAGIVEVQAGSSAWLETLTPA